jgi:hypothetical protein
MPGAVPNTGLPVGTILTYNATIQSSVWASFKSGLWTPDSVFQNLGIALGGWGLGIVKSDYGGIQATFSSDVPIVLTLQMQGPQTYGQPNDVRSIVDGAIGDILGGSYINSSNISNWTIPQSAGGSGQAVDTGAPGNTTSLVGDALAATGIDPTAIGDAISNTVANATKNLGAGTGTIILILGLAVVAAALIAVAPTAPARAIAAARRRR